MQAKPLPQLIKYLCANWAYFNLPYLQEEARLRPLQDKQAYLTSLDAPK